VIRTVNKAVAIVLTERFGMVRTFGNRLLPCIQVGAYQSQGICSPLIIQRIFIGSVSSNPSWSGSRTGLPRCLEAAKLETQCNQAATRCARLSHRSGHGGGDRIISSLISIGCTSGSGLIATGMASGRYSWPAS
jgi:hypothetical protein